MALHVQRAYGIGQAPFPKDVRPGGAVARTVITITALALTASVIGVGVWGVSKLARRS